MSSIAKDVFVVDEEQAADRRRRRPMIAKGKLDGQLRKTRSRKNSDGNLGSKRGRKDGPGPVMDCDTLRPAVNILGT